jgi:hypothetical protein
MNSVATSTIFEKIFVQRHNIKCKEYRSKNKSFVDDDDDDDDDDDMFRK